MTKERKKGAHSEDTVGGKFITGTHISIL